VSERVQLRGVLQERLRTDGAIVEFTVDTEFGCRIFAREKRHECKKLKNLHC
jgi:hypothetical protein